MQKGVLLNTKQRSGGDGDERGGVAWRGKYALEGIFVFLMFLEALTIFFWHKCCFLRETLFFH